MSKIRWLRLPLVLLLGPVVYYLVWYGIGEWQKPVPLYTVKMPEGDRAYEPAQVYGDYWFHLLARHPLMPEGEPRRTYRLSDGSVVAETIRAIVEKQVLPAEQLMQLPREPYRYEKYFNRGDWREEVHDKLTSSYYKLPQQVNQPWLGVQANRTGTHLLVAQKWKTIWAAQCLEACLSPLPVSLMVNLRDLAMFAMPLDSLQRTEVFTVLTLPDCRVVASNILCPFETKLDYSDRADFVRALSPSGRWLVVAEHSNEEHSSKAHWTRLWLYDTQQRSWRGVLAELKGSADRFVFTSDSLLQLYTQHGTDHSSSCYSVPQGTLLDQYQFNFSYIPLFTMQLADNCYLRVSPYTHGNVNLSSLHTAQLTEDGQLQPILTTQTDNQIYQAASGLGHQVLLTRSQSMPIPEWILRWIPIERLKLLLTDRFGRNKVQLLDTKSNQTLLQCSDDWRGVINERGDYLVMSQMSERDRLLQVAVYALPLPVWSRWWGHGAAAIATLLFALWLMRRSPRNQLHALDSKSAR